MPLADGVGHDAVVGEGAQGGLGHRVDDARGDQLLHVEDIGVRRVLGPGARPQRPLRAGAGVAEREPSLVGEPPAEAGVGMVGVGDRHPAAQLGAVGEHGVGLGVDARDEERRHRGDGEGRAGGQAALEPPHVGVDDLLVARDGEQQRDVDVDPVGDELLDRRHSRLRRRHLDHDVGAGQPDPQLERLRDGRGRVVGEVRGALERDEPVAAVARVVGRAQQVGGAPDVVQRELEEQLPRARRRRGARPAGAARRSDPTR